MFLLSEESYRSTGTVKASKLVFIILAVIRMLQVPNSSSRSFISEMKFVKCECDWSVTRSRSMVIKVNAKVLNILKTEVLQDQDEQNLCYSRGGLTSIYFTIQVCLTDTLSFCKCNIKNRFRLLLLLPVLTWV